MKDVNEQFAFGGKHYVGAITTNSQCAMFYNKKTIAENGLDDPVELLAQGNWFHSLRQRDISASRALPWDKEGRSVSYSAYIPERARITKKLLPKTVLTILWSFSLRVTGTGILSGI